MIQAWGLYACLFTYWAKNIEWDRFGGNQKGLPEKLLNKWDGKEALELVATFASGDETEAA